MRVIPAAFIWAFWGILMVQFTHWTTRSFKISTCQNAHAFEQFSPCIQLVSSQNFIIMKSHSNQSQNNFIILVSEGKALVSV